MPAPRLIWLAPLAALPAAVEDAVLAELDAVELAVPFCCLAAAWKAPKLFGPVSTALTLKTMPEPQWLPCLQYAQIGAVSLTVIW